MSVYLLHVTYLQKCVDGQRLYTIEFLDLLTSNLYLAEFTNQYIPFWQGSIHTQLFLRWVS